jgi:cold shock protein
MIKGTVKFFNQEKGFGFIKNLESNEEIFVHRTSVQNQAILNEGDMVTYEIGNGKRGEMAVNVSISDNNSDN